MRNSVRRNILLASILLTLTIMGKGLDAQTFTVLHNFTGGADGGNPYAGVTLDRAGNLYGTTYSGTVYKMTHTGVSWTLATLGNVGETWAGVTIGPNGSLYGTTLGGNGTIFNLRPPVHACANVLCSWTETVLYSFRGGTDGATPYSSVTFDQAGNIYGTTFDGGSHGDGTVFELSPSDGGWTESIIYAFSGSNGQSPVSGVTLDAAGNLYGTTWAGGTGSCNYSGSGGCGTVFELTYSGESGWAESFLYSFANAADGETPYAGLIFDPSGNLYGAAAGGGGPVFEFTSSGGNWTYSLVYSLGGGDQLAYGPRGTLVMDETGNLYGTTYAEPLNGTVFKLTPSDNGTWTYTLLHGFTGPDGEYPQEGVTLDANGNLYGTTSYGGRYGYGVVWEITP
jgi:uncharacterized repeat protein (TIGR03803 family)